MDTNNAKKEVSRRTFIKTTITTAASLTFSSWGVPTLLRAQTKPIKIGCVTPLTGPMTGFGLPTKAAMEYSCDKLNKEGGILGSKVIPFYRDEELSAEVAVRGQGSNI